MAVDRCNALNLSYSNKAESAARLSSTGCSMRYGTSITLCSLDFAWKARTCSFRLESWKICRVGVSRPLGFCTTSQSNMKVNFKPKKWKFPLQVFEDMPVHLLCPFVIWWSHRNAFNLVAVCWLRHCATSRRVPGSIPGHWGFFQGHQTVPCALGSTQPLKISTRIFLGVKTAGA
jgi:hypothetical protein